MSAPVPRFPNEKNENGNQAHGDKHPVLAFKTQKRKMLDQKMHCFRLRFLQNKLIACARYAFWRLKYIIFISLAGQSGAIFYPCRGLGRNQSTWRIAPEIEARFVVEGRVKLFW
jgi:hypothetical protein